MRAFRAIMFSVAILVLFLAVYVGAYYATVKPQRTPRGEATFIGGGTIVLPPMDMVAAYRFGGEWSAMLFAPIHAIDRRVRADVWRSTP